MSGIEAIYWAQKYPDEVKAIIGLDPAIPEVYDDFPIPSSFIISISAFAARTGITRYLPSICENSAAIQSGRLSETDKEMYRAVFYRSTQTSNMLDEIKQIKDNAEYVKEKGIPYSIPMYFFISDGAEIPIDNWGALLSGYVDKLVHGKYMELNCGHYVHNFETEIIARESKQFIDDILTGVSYP